MQKQSATVTENRKISFMESQIFQNGQNTIWKCSLCAAFVAITLRVLMNHYYTVHSNEVNFSVRCGINECPATFKRYHSFYKHIRKKHHHEYESKVKEDVNYSQCESDSQSQINHDDPVDDHGCINLSQASTRHCSSTGEGSSDSSSDDEVPHQVCILMVNQIHYIVITVKCKLL